MTRQRVHSKSPTGPHAQAAPDPCTVVIFGGSGDLARRKLIPALYNLLLDGLLPSPSAVLGLGRKPLTGEEFRGTLREGADQHSRQPLTQDSWPDFEQRLYYQAGSIDDPDTYEHLRRRLEELEKRLNLPGHRLFYLAIPPDSITGVCLGLQKAGLVARSRDTRCWRRVVVEKPNGHDLASAKAINATVGSVFDESQIFRIDHYLGKETVQNIKVLRFANSIFEPLWNHKYVDHVQITVSEAEGLGTRAAYYGETGALRDMVQNHILQLLCLVAMEPPYSLDPDVVRDARIDVLRCLKPIRGQDVDRFTVRGQYGPGKIAGKAVAGFREEPGITVETNTETYAAIKLFVENWRWAGVPFYLRTGKALVKRATEIAVQFKDIPEILFNT
ncbi:MAG: glucose-6-phosphate dehydrogenase, partial [Nitrospirales bacterium]